MVSEVKQTQIIMTLAEKGGEFLANRVGDIPPNHAIGLSHLLAIAPMLMKEEEGTPVDAVQDLIDHVTDIGKSKGGSTEEKCETPIALLQEFKSYLEKC